MATLVIVTGGSRGIGAAACRHAPDGSHILEVSRSGGTPDTEHIPADLADPATWATVGQRVAAVIADRQPERTVFIHSAALLSPVGFAGEVDADAYLANVLLNSAATQVLGHHYLAAVRNRPGRHQLCLVSSGASTGVLPGWSGYGAGKAAMDHWVRNVGAEQRVRGGVEVTAIAPGVVDTAMQEEIRGTDTTHFPDVDRFHDYHRTGQLRSPDDVAVRLWELLDAGMPTGTVRRLWED